MTDGTETGVSEMPGSDPVSAAQKRAAHAYAVTLLDAEVAAGAAADAVAAFRQTLAQRGDVEGEAQSAAANETLLALTRLMTAVSVPDASQPADRRQAVWASIGSSSHCTCREAAALLATRANGNIQPREGTALDEHLAGCANCQELAAKTATAERAFRAEIAPPPARGGISALPRSAYAVLALLVAAGVAIVALATGGGSHSADQSAAAIHIKTTDVALSVTSVNVAPAPTPVHSATHHAAHHAAITPHHRRVTTASTHAKTVKRASSPAHRATPQSTTAHPTSSGATASPSTSTQSPAVTAAAASSPSSSATPSTPAVSRSSSASAAEATPTSHAAPAASASPSTGAAPSSAAVAGQTSLPADSAPQQGIGSLTTAQ